MKEYIKLSKYAKAMEIHYKTGYRKNKTKAGGDKECINYLIE